MEIEYHENNPPTLKPLVHVSLSDLDPLALLQLRATGRCTLRTPESFFDRSGPGEYFRRIHSVAVSVPCIVGAYAGVHCKLTLRNSTIRKSAALPENAGGYTPEGLDDARFESFRGLVQSVVASSAQSDTGTVDEGDAGIRSAPFQFNGVVGEWDIELPADPSKGEPTTFDYSTIADVTLSIRYTARDGGDRLKKASMAALIEEMKTENAVGAARLFSIRHDFPDAWARFKNYTANPTAFAPLDLKLTDRHYPFWARDRLNAVTRAMMLVPRATNPIKIRRSQIDSANDDTTAPLYGSQTSGISAATLVKNPLLATQGDAKWLVSDDSMPDMWLFIQWQG